MGIHLSAAVITYNEEHNIRRCLKALQEVAEDIVVIDSFSTDNTEEICKEMNVRFIQNPFEGHIQQKNFALSQCKHEYVLSVDADEVLSEELQKSILEVKSNWQYDGYELNRLTSYCGNGFITVVGTLTEN